MYAIIDFYFGVIVMTTQHILFSWIGDNDLKDIGRTEQFGALYSICFSEIAKFTKIILLSNRDNTHIQDYLKWLDDRLTTMNAKIEFEYFNENSDPTDYQFIYQKSEYVIKKYTQSGDFLYFNLTSGTPTMSATWLLLGTSIFKAILIQSSRQKGVEIVTVPYEISLQNKQDTTISDIGNNILLNEFQQAKDSMQNINDFVQLFAPRNIPVMIQGETGSGKEVLARQIHNNSPRKDRSFIAINCGAINDNLVDSELFGYKKGAFTGANTDRKGHFENAHLGTLFLDEIGELPLSSQVKLLRVLQEKEVVPVGDSRPIKIDVRVICATHRDLLKMVQNGEFREDLYYRLAVGVIGIPALRDRSKNNIIQLSEDLLKEINQKFYGDGFTQKQLSACATDFICSQYWSGNIRELQNTLLRACIYYPNIKTLKEKHISSVIINISNKSHENLVTIEIPTNAPQRIKDIKKLYAQTALKMTNNRKNKAGELLKISSQVLDNWLGDAQ